MTTIALQAAGTPDWLERINRAVEAITESAKSVQAAVVRERATVRFYLAARTLNGHINELVSALDQTTRDLQDGKLKLKEEAEDPQEVLANIKRAYQIVHGLYVISTFIGLKKRQLTSAQVINFGESADKILDYLIWLEEGISEEHLAKAASHFAEALDELEKGETVPFL